MLTVAVNEQKVEPGLNCPRPRHLDPILVLGPANHWLAARQTEIGR